ncbi:hypothetical protein PIB30_016360 [Stylosanthes scabra]|uniref:Uncharacterized protein n=1 Tax=Stylosanthes scabra TaxID=79078 RepID=A0ABU6T991_9FABA|nr:hypothetical protein [Stylosanthes scabra]
MASKKNRDSANDDGVVLDPKLMLEAISGELHKIQQWLDDMDARIDSLPSRKSHSRDSVRNQSEESDSDSSSKARRSKRSDDADSNINAIKMRIPGFKGRTDPEAYLEWERKVEIKEGARRQKEAHKKKLSKQKQIREEDFEEDHENPEEDIECSESDGEDIWCIGKQCGLEKNYEDRTLKYLDTNTGNVASKERKNRRRSRGKKKKALEIRGGCEGEAHLKGMECALQFMMEDMNLRGECLAFASNKIDIVEWIQGKKETGWESRFLRNRANKMKQYEMDTLGVITNYGNNRLKKRGSLKD